MTTPPNDPTAKVTGPAMDTPIDDSAPPTTTGRRGFLKIGGLGVAVTAFAAACVQQVKVTDKMATTGTLIPAPSTSEPPFAGSAEMDAEITLTALSLEKLLVDTYALVLTSGWLTSAGLPAAARALAELHEEHIADLEALARLLGQDPSKVEANATVKTDEVEPLVETIKADAADKGKAEVDAVTLLIDLEDTVGQLYNKAGGEGTTTALRAQFSALGGAQGRYFAVLALAIDRPPAPFALAHTAPAALTDEAWIKPNGPVRTTGTTPGTTAS